MLDNLKNMLGTERENQLLHYSIGNEYLKSNEFDLAEKHLRKAVSLDPDYSAGWKLLGKTLNAAEKYDIAVDVFLDGIEVAEKRGDIQAAKEMKVFLKRARKNSQ
ncbi:MAG: tetratricopeptide repeat protein [Gammaproteobacteria bacterium]|nr:tetratricopeptide repeat protein [Gammaproteobacteria bacterium]MBT8449253.1 tetratricopeptide repeat protein [Gammaproteobacteria bacterium]NNJ90094.1 tetratricopeptide repeat protein [Gammaproteobacteria bacterium]